ncbi:protein PRRC1-like [Aricia agestis]|uniref:protein PRRC1-like n=1 Tax=Aricia agestis TaxID=91739 RepID=UPI001C2082ED|nr:protein PRRC1-like [Aricia agestis]
MNNTEKKNKIPAAPVLVTSGNLLSNVAPPTQLPNFVTSAPAPSTQNAEASSTADKQTAQAKDAEQPAPEPMEQSPRTPENFSPAIPLCKGEPTMPLRSPEDSQETLSTASLPVTPETDRIGDIMPGSGLLTWVKGAVSTGGILQRVAEKAKSSVDSMITTLDPQMKEYLRSGGDLLVVVASDKDVKISPVREAFQTVFGKATVIGYEAQSDVTAAQPVSYAAAYAAAKQRVAYLRSVRADLHNNVPVVAIESYIQEAVTDRWFEQSLLLLSQPSLGIELQLVSQATPLPAAAAAAARAATPSDYAHAQTGYGVTVGSVMADSLQVPHTQWQEATCGVSRRELLLLAARSIAGSYKNLLAVSAAET